MENWSHFHRGNRHLKGQAILELAIFGAMLIMLLGILVNYGLRYNQQQKIMQHAFRKALASAAVSMNSDTPISVSHTLVKDKHIPNPSDSFASGSIMPVTAGAGSPIRSYDVRVTPDNENELSHTVFDIQGQLFSFKTSGFVEEANIPVSSKDRYNEIYGEVLGCASLAGDTCSEWVVVDDKAIEEEKVIITPDNKIARIRFIDYCAGEIISYGTAVRQCRLIVDTKACTRDCRRAGGKDCAGTCSQWMNIPWYCQDYTEIDTANHKYIFPNIERMFSFTLEKNVGMGVQGDTVQSATRQDELNKKENSSEIDTTDNLNYGVDTRRVIVYKPYGSTDTNTTNQTVTSSVSQNRTHRWQTPW